MTPGSVIGWSVVGFPYRCPLQGAHGAGPVCVDLHDKGGTKVIRPGLATLRVRASS